MGKRTARRGPTRRGQLRSLRPPSSATWTHKSGSPTARPCCQPGPATAKAKLLDQIKQPPARVDLSIVVTGCVLNDRVDRDSVHTQSCCYERRVHSIALALLHRCH